MSHNILIDGAAGGGSVLARLLSQQDIPIKPANITAVVRSDEQVKALTRLGVNVVQTKLADEKAVAEIILQNEIDIVVHTATSVDGQIASNLITGLGQRRKVTGKDVYYIHAAVTTLFSLEGGWPFGEVKDTDPIFEREQELLAGHPVRDTNILVTKSAKRQGVKSINVALPNVYGRGTGEWRKLTVNTPAHVRAGIKNNIVHKFDKDGHPPTAHISDVEELYALLITKIMKEEPVPTGEQGYYFAVAHRFSWHDTMDGIAAALHARGLVESREVKVWPSDQMAAEHLGFPAQFIRAMCTSSGDLVPVNAIKLGWQPKWDEKKYLGSIDDEVQAVLDLDIGPTNLFNVFKSKNGDGSED